MTAIRSRRWRRRSESIAKAGAQADQGRVRGAAARHRPGRGDEARRADPAQHVRTKGVKGADQPSNVIERLDLAMGDVDAGLRRGRRDRRARIRHQADASGLYRAAELRRDRRPRTARSSCGAAPRRRGCSATGCPNILKIDTAKIRVQQSEMGGGFGGKTGFYAEPVAIQLARKAKRPVKITLTRNEVFRATGPVSGTKSRIKMGVKKDGTITAAEAELIFQTGAFTGSVFSNAPQAMFTRYCAQERQDDVLRGRVEPPEGEFVPRALRAAGRVRRRRRDRRARAQDRHGPDRPAPEERGDRRLQDDLWRDLRPDRLRRDAAGREEVRALQFAGAARARAAASPPASGSTAAARPPARSTSRPTARSRSSSAPPTSPARASRSA